MRSTFSGIEIAKRSLFAQQTALQTTAHNIANANTVGYTRQVVNFVASKPLEAVGLMRSNVPGQIGTGVEFDYIKRIRERFLDHQYYNENKNLGNWNIRLDTLEKLEAIVNEPSDTGVRQVIEKFWNAWQVVSKEPDNTTGRAALKETALALTDSFNHTSNQLKALKEDLTENINVKAREVNSYLDQMAKLNNEIFRVEGLGNSANDLRDQRDLIADNLSKIINIDIEETAGGYNLRMGSLDLVQGISVVNNFSASGGDGIAFEDALVAGDLNAGEVYGMLVSRDQYLVSYEYQFDSMVQAFVEGDVNIQLPKGSVLPPSLPPGTRIGAVTYDGTEILTEAERVLLANTDMVVKGINGIHALGYTIENPPSSGVPFFTIKSGDTTFNASSIQVNPDIVAKVAKIASSARVLTDNNNQIVLDANGHEIVVKGNNVIALTIAEFRNKRISFDPNSTGIPMLTNGTFDEFFRAVVGQLGIETQEANRQSVNQKILVDQVDGRRQSISGVSLDEEMANMIKYQHAYNAAARAMTTFDEALDKIINGMGRVGL